MSAMTPAVDPIPAGLCFDHSMNSEKPMRDGGRITLSVGAFCCEGLLAAGPYDARRRRAEMG